MKRHAKLLIALASVASLTLAHASDAMAQRARSRGGANRGGADTAAAGKPAYAEDVEFKDMLAFHHFKLGDLKGRLVIFHHWLSDDEDAKSVVDYLKRAFDDYHDKGLEIISVSGDDSKFDVRKAVVSMKLPWVHCHNSGKFARQTEGNKVAANSLWLVDPDGNTIIKDEEIRSYKHLSDAIEEALKNTPVTTSESFAEKIGRLQMERFKQIEADDPDPWEAIWGYDGLYQRFGEKSALAKEAHAEYLRLRDATWGQEDLDKARELVKNEKFKDAMIMYRRIIRDYVEGSVVDSAKKEVKQLEGSDDVQVAMIQNQADKKAPGKIRMGKTLVRNGNPDKAKKYFKEVIESFPGTTYAKEAQEELDKID